MADATELPVKSEEKSRVPAGAWSPLETLRTEIDRLFDDFAPASWRPFDRSVFGRALPSLTRWSTVPAIDVVENDDAFEVALLRRSL